MSIVNGSLLLAKQPIVGMISEKRKEHGVSWGLAEAGYDIRIKQQIEFRPLDHEVVVDGKRIEGKFVLASTIEEFNMPSDLVGVVHDKSTWARQGLSVFNTVIEPGWKGFLTLELVFHSNQRVFIPAGSGIAQVLFSSLMEPHNYEGKYQNQEDRPVKSIFEK